MPSPLQQNQFRSILLKPEKTLEDAQYIYEKIRQFRFFEGFFAANLRSMDTYDILTLCQGFQYETIEKGRFVFKRGDDSNNKFYIILSGLVSIIIPNEQEQLAQNKARKTKKVLKSLQRIEIIDDTITPMGMGTSTPKKQPFTQPPLLNQASFEDYSKILSKRKTLKTMGSFANNDPQPQEALSPEESARASHRKLPFPRFGASLNHIAEISEQDEHNVAVEHPTFRPHHFSLERLSAPDIGTAHTLKDVKGVTERESAIYLSSRRNNPEEFEEEIAKYGRLLRDLDTGESFGDLALISDAQRSASVLCKSDCELLVVTKDQFDSLFLKKEAEKEEFLKVIFPFLASDDVISPGAFSMLLYSFKTEVYTRGSYLTIEGNPNTVNPKFFALQHGECVVEKTLPSDASPPNDKGKVHHEAAQIAVVGRGMLIGEEVLQPHRSYEYSVRAMSDHVVVYSITRFDFEAVFFKEFQAMVLDMYKKKKKQREIMFEISKKEHGQAKADHLYFIKSPTAKTPTASKNINRGFTRYADRETKASSHDEASLNRLILSQKGPRSQTDHSFANAPGVKEFPITAPHIPDLDSSPVDNEHQAMSPSKSPARGKVRILTIEEMKDPKRRNIEARIDFLQKLPEKPKNVDTPFDPKEMEKTKFFKEKDPKKIKVQNILKARLLNINLSKTPTAFPRQSSAGIISTDLARSVRRLQSKSSAQADFKALPTLESQLPTLHDESPSVFRPFSPKVSRTISVLTKLQESPLKSKPMTRVTTAATVTHKRYSKLDSRGFESYANSPAGFNHLLLDRSPSKSSAYSKTLATDPDESPLIYQKNRLNFHTPHDYLIRNVLTIDAEDTESSLIMSSSKGRGELLSSKRGNRAGIGGSKMPTAGAVFGAEARVNSVNSQKMGSGSQTPGNLHLKKKVEFRKKVFKKTSLKSLDLKATPMKGFTFMVNTLDSKNNKIKIY